MVNLLLLYIHITTTTVHVHTTTTTTEKKYRYTGIDGFRTEQRIQLLSSIFIHSVILHHTAGVVFVVCTMLLSYPMAFQNQLAIYKQKLQ